MPESISALPETAISIRRQNAAMRRRDLIAALAGAAAAWPLGTRAQQVGRMRRIAVLQPQRDSDRQARSWVEAFRLRLRELGWNDANLTIDYRWYGGDLERLRRYASELVGLEPDVIFCMSTPTVRALKRVTSRVPIVFVNANNPVGSGFVASMARPGGNITGFVAFEPSVGGKWLEILREIAPGVARVGLVYNPRTHTGQHFKTLEAVSPRLGLKLVRLSFNDVPDIERRFEEFAREPNGGLIILPDSSSRVHRDVIVRLAARHRLPAVYAYRLFIASGGLAFYGANTMDQFRKGATYVDQVLRGARPAELPVQAPTRFELVVNRKAAQALGLSIPRSILLRATEVVE